MQKPSGDDAADAPKLKHDDYMFYDPALVTTILSSDDIIPIRAELEVALSYVDIFTKVGLTPVIAVGQVKPHLIFTTSEEYIFRKMH
jgi:hypothetical protein